MRTVILNSRINVFQKEIKCIAKMISLGKLKCHQDNMSVKCIPPYTPLFVVKMGCTEVNIFS